MSFFAGWVDCDIKNNAVRSVADHMADTIPKHLGVQTTIKLLDFANCVADKHILAQDGHCLLVVDGNAKMSEQHLQDILAHYHAMGDSFVENLSPPFALVLADLDKKTLILATDPIGQRHMYYAQTRNGLVFGSTADSVVAHPDVSNELSLQTIYNYVYFHHCPSPTTIYKSVYKLEGGQILIYHADKIKVWTYWLPQFTENSVSLLDAGKELQQYLQDAVRHMADTPANTGAFLSGGLDSSSVAGMLSKVFPEQAQSFTMGFPVEGYDEMEYARIAVKHFNLKAHEYYLSPDEVVSAVPAIAQYYDEPFGNSSALAAFYCAKMAKAHGIDILLAGDGGDELFAGNDRYAKQGLFENYQKVPGIAKKPLQMVLGNLPQSLQKGVLHKAKRYVEQANTPLPDRLQDYNFLHRHASEHVFSEQFIEAIDTHKPLQTLRDTYHRPQQASALNRMMYMDWKSTLHDNDLVKVNKMCEMAGVKVQYPFLDQAIIDLSCRIPSDVKLKGQKLRWFYKQAVTGFLPDQIINKSKHGFGLPFGYWLKSHDPLKELAYDSIHALKQRDFFLPEFLDNAVAMHQSVHASYYGELIWILMMLELWLQGKQIH